MTIPQDGGRDTNDGTNAGIARLQSEMRAAVRAHWKAFLIEGILLVILGLAAIVVPPLASLAVTIFLGWMFLISGIAGLALTFWARAMPGFWWSLISAILALIAGFILLTQPAQGTYALTLVVGVYFLAEGVATIMYALEHRRELSERWGWLLVAGIVDIVIAFIIISGLPGSATWALGLLVGINLVFGGSSMIGMALAARQA
ncbi:MAG: HdeD family acid-resistance protein [Gemmatimonas sp.]